MLKFQLLITQNVTVFGDRTFKEVIKAKCGYVSISALLTMPKPLTAWMTINCGKF